jgi:hypothetical protein
MTATSTVPAADARNFTGVTLPTDDGVRARSAGSHPTEGAPRAVAAAIILRRAVLQPRSASRYRTTAPSPSRWRGRFVMPPRERPSSRSLLDVVTPEPVDPGSAHVRDEPVPRPVADTAGRHPEYQRGRLGRQPHVSVVGWSRLHCFGSCSSCCSGPGARLVPLGVPRRPRLDLRAPQGRQRGPVLHTRMKLAGAHRTPDRVVHAPDDPSRLVVRHPGGSLLRARSSEPLERPAIDPPSPFPYLGDQPALQRQPPQVRGRHAQDGSRLTRRHPLGHRSRVERFLSVVAPLSTRKIRARLATWSRIPTMRTPRPTRHLAAVGDLIARPVISNPTRTGPSTMTERAVTCACSAEHQRTPHPLDRRTRVAR